MLSLFTSEVVGQDRSQLDYGYPGISGDMHGANNIDVALHGAVRPNSPFGIGHVSMRVGKVLLKERLS